MEGVVVAPAGPKSRVNSWIGQHPGIIALILAAIVGLVVLPALAGAVKDHDVQINGLISLIAVVWLIVAVVLCIVCLVVRSGVSRDLGDGLRQLIAATQPSDGTVRRTGAANPDTPILGAAIVRGIFDLIVLLVIQGIVRVPLVEVIGAYAPKALVDGGFVALVVVVALVMLFGLHRVSKPLTEYLVTVGLDRLVPTAGFAAGNLPDAPAPRTTTRTPAPSSAARPTAQPTLAAGSDLPTVATGSDLPTEAAAATIIAPENRFSAEATIAAPPAGSADATVADDATLAPTDGETTVAGEKPMTGPERSG